VSNRPRDLWDVLQNLTIQSTPFIAAEEQTQDAFEAPDVQQVTLSDAVSFPNLGHSGTYVFDDPTSLFDKAQFS